METGKGRPKPRASQRIFRDEARKSSLSRNLMPAAPPAGPRFRTFRRRGEQRPGATTPPVQARMRQKMAPSANEKEPPGKTGKEKQLSLMTVTAQITADAARQMTCLARGAVRAVLFRRSNTANAPGLPAHCGAQHNDKKDADRRGPPRRGARGVA